jgi:3-deoxy-D-manno-octulosonate 8-phosphate phosphatase (KDO 8-P phosphatase)
MRAIRDKAAQVRLAIFDVDGVLTDGRLILGDDGSEYKAFYVRDGLGLVLLREAGIQVAVISGRESRVTAERMAALGIEYVYQNSNNKADTLAELLARLSLDAVQTAYTGDDLIDLPVFDRVGLSIAVADAHPLVRERADWVTPAAGGRGAAREVCELLLESQGHWAAVLARYQAPPN